MHRRSAVFPPAQKVFSTEAGGVSVIGMTAMPEAKLAREAELPYATVAFATDYDCWHHEAEAVSVDAVIAVLHKNADLAKRIVVVKLSTALPNPADSPATGALKYALITAKNQITRETRARLDWLIALYTKE